jgi:hypothetical protein
VVGWRSVSVPLQDRRARALVRTAGSSSSSNACLRARACKAWPICCARCCCPRARPPAPTRAPPHARTFSGQDSIWLLARMAQMPLNGAGMSGKSKRLNSPGLSGIAKIMLCSFHCSRSSMPSSCGRSRRQQRHTQRGVSGARAHRTRAHTSPAAAAAAAACCCASHPRLKRPTANTPRAAAHTTQRTLNTFIMFG